MLLWIFWQFPLSVTKAFGIYDGIATLSEERAESLQFRIDNDNRLIEKAIIQPFFVGRDGREITFMTKTGRI